MNRTSNTRLPCITNDGGMIIVTGPTRSAGACAPRGHQDILPRLLKGIAGRLNVQRRMKNKRNGGQTCSQCFRLRGWQGSGRDRGQRSDVRCQRSEVRGQNR
ncbi:MAG: hypothetical protein U9R02_00045 [Thermodesulfobacteriota bacterium]|nr:hypothetical protein [Thermodesulfobacteriota bacterium]